MCDTGSDVIHLNILRSRKTKIHFEALLLVRNQEIMGTDSENSKSSTTQHKQTFSQLTL